MTLIGGGLHGGMVNNPALADIIFNFGVEKVQLFAHSIIINVRCPALIHDPKSKAKKKKGSTTYEITSYTSRTLLEILNFLYTGMIEFGKLSAPQILYINAAAQELKLPRLSWLCENHIRTNLALDNIFSIVKVADQLKQQSVKEICFYFAIKNYTTFVENKEGIKDLGPDLFQEIAEANQKSLVGEVKEPEGLNEPKDTIKEDFKNIYDTMENTDCIFQIESDKNGNELIRCHKSILSSQSQELQSLCSLPTTKIPKTKTSPEYRVIRLPGIKLKNGYGNVISSDAFRSMLKWIYYGDININPISSSELIPFSKDCGLIQLQNVCEKICLDNINSETAISVLSVTYLPQMEDRETVSRDLRKNSIDYILSNLRDIDLDNLGDMNPDISLDILLVHQSILKLEEQRLNGNGIQLTIRSNRSSFVPPSLSTPPLSH